MMRTKYACFTRNFERANEKQKIEVFGGKFPDRRKTLMYIFLFGAVLIVGLWLLLTISLSAVSRSLACFAMFSGVVLGWLFRKFQSLVDERKRPSTGTDMVDRPMQTAFYDLKQGRMGTYIIVENKKQKTPSHA